MTIGHKKQWDFLKKNFESGQLSHAYLFTGTKNIGKKDFAKEFAEFVNCKFPDLMIIEEGKPARNAEHSSAGGEIPVVKIRDVQNFLAYKSYNGGFKIVIVDEAEKMNQEAQSCFLKTLEEPKGQTLLILISSKPDMLLQTIFSRCQQVKFFGKPILKQETIDEENKILQSFLEISGCDLAEKFKYAKSLDFEKQKLSQLLDVLQKYLRHIMLKKTDSEGEEEKRFSEITSVFENYPVLKLKKIIKSIEEINSKLLFTNVNQKLALEILLLEI